MRQYINLYQGFEAPPLFGRSLLLLGAALLLTLAGLGAYGWWLRGQVQALQADADSLARQSSVGQQRLVALGGRLNQPGGALASLSRLEAQHKSREQLLAALKSGALGSLDGYSIYLRGLSHQTGQGVWLTAFAVSQDSIGLTGRAMEAQAIPAYLSLLNGEAAFQGKKFTALKVKQAVASEDGGKAFAGVEFTLGPTQAPSDPLENLVLPSSAPAPAVPAVEQAGAK